MQTAVQQTTKERRSGKERWFKGGLERTSEKRTAVFWFQRAQLRTAPPNCASSLSLAPHHDRGGADFGAPSPPVSSVDSPTEASPEKLKSPMRATAYARERVSCKSLGPAVFPVFLIFAPLQPHPYSSSTLPPRIPLPPSHPVFLLHPATPYSSSPSRSVAERPLYRSPRRTRTLRSSARFVAAPPASKPPCHPSGTHRPQGYDPERSIYASPAPVLTNGQALPRTRRPRYTVERFDGRSTARGRANHQGQRFSAADHVAHLRERPDAQSVCRSDRRAGPDPVALAPAW